MSEEIKLVQSGLTYGSVFIFTIFVVLTTIYISRYFFPITINVDDQGNVYVKKELFKKLNASFKMEDEELKSSLNKEDEENKKVSYSLIEIFKVPVTQPESITESATEIFGDNLTDPLVTDRMFN